MVEGSTRNLRQHFHSRRDAAKDCNDCLRIEDCLFWRINIYNTIFSPAFPPNNRFQSYYFILACDVLRS